VRSLAVVVVGGLLALGCGSDPADDLVERPGGANIGEWAGVRTTAAGDLLILVTGMPELQQGNPCTAEYRPVVAETDVEVRVTITAWVPDVTYNGCSGPAFSQEVEVDLKRPLGDRQLVDGGLDRREEVFDGATLLEPTDLPDGWAQLSETKWNFAEDLGWGWTRTWGPRLPRTGGGCSVAGPQSISLTQGAVDVMEFYRSSGIAGDELEIRGQPATLVTGGGAADLALVWEEGATGFVLWSASGCSNDTPPTEDELLRFADSLS
jgi:hypothetical protein